MDYIKRIFLEVLDKDYDHETPDKPRTVAFHKACTKALKEMVRPYNYVVHTSSPNWRDFTAFVEDPESGKYIFVSCEYNDSHDSKWGNHVMYRAAKSLKDYSGGSNNFTDFNSLGEEIHKLFQVTSRGVWESTPARGKQGLVGKQGLMGKQGLDSLSVATEDNNDFFGKLEVEKYGEAVVEALGGKKISKEKQFANMRGGISYEASRLGMAWTDLIRTLEGLCYLRRAEEIDDSTYYVYPPNSHILGSQEGLFDKVLSVEKTKLQTQALKELIEEKNDGEDDNLLEGITEAAATEYSDGLRLYQVSKGYAIVAQSYYDNYANRAFVDRVVSTIEEARIVQASLERNDRMSFTIFNCNTRPIVAEESTYGEFFETRENNKMNNEMNFDDEDFGIEPEEDMEEGDNEFENGPEEDVERIKREKAEDMDKYNIGLGLVQEVDALISQISQVEFMLPEYSDILKEIYNQELH
ncbi:MAG: hypothetical protein EOM67_13830, partial [Spirochaetia bacterium]|nr:hypothetical protein [Spirochaetia bacterium]